MSTIHLEHKRLFADVQTTMRNFNSGSVRDELLSLLSPDALARMCHPFGDIEGPGNFYDTAFAPLLHAFPDLERTDYIVAAGQDHMENAWLGCAGHYTGTFMESWLDIPPTGHFAHLRFHEFYRFENTKITEAQIIWDIPSLMMQASVWPMAPSLGQEIMVPAPATQDGISNREIDEETTKDNLRIVSDMLEHLIKHPKEGGPEVMKMEWFWHPKMNWYGPSGIGTCRGIDGFRKWHQVPFLKAMPDRGQYPGEISHHFFAENNYVAVTGWPNMMQTLTGDGWLGLAPTGKKISLRSLDFWRVEKNLIRENWVLVDLLDAYNQVGINVFERMREYAGRLLRINPVGSMV